MVFFFLFILNEQVEFKKITLRRQYLLQRAFVSLKSQRSSLSGSSTTSRGLFSLGLFGVLPLATYGRFSLSSIAMII